MSVKFLCPGYTNGDWLVIKPIDKVYKGKNKWSRSYGYWLCECTKCNTVHERIGKDIVSPKSKCCTNCRTQKAPIDLTGKRFGNLLVIESSKEKRKCLCDCGSITFVRGADLISGHTKSCGCYHIKRATESNINPLLSSYDREQSRKTNKNMIWSFSVKQRDNFTCQKCFDSKGGNLISHHLNSYSAFPEERLLVENGITLCNKCHKLFHSEYGYGDNTKEQFFEWKNKGG